MKKVLSARNQLATEVQQMKECLSNASQAQQHVEKSQ
jgi:hypothetical protein